MAGLRGRIGAGAIDVTCGLAALSLLGPSAPELLARFCAIDVRPAVTPPTGFRPGSVARTPGYLLVEAENQLLLLVGWALGEYLWHVVADAAARASGTPFISYYAPDEILTMARDAGFATARHVTAADYTQRYFADRTDGLRPFTTEELLVATT